MDGEQGTIATTEPASPTIDPAIVNDEPVNLDALAEQEAEAEADAGAEQPQPEDDDSEEFEWEGKKFRGPKGLKNGLMMQADYTRKTQETAAIKRELDERAATLAQQAQASSEELNARATLVAIEAQLKRFENVDWGTWEQQDWMAAQSAFREYTQLKEARGQAASFLGERQRARTEEAQRESAKRVQETREYAAKNIKGWSEDMDRQMSDFAMKELGIDGNTLREAAYSPALYRALHLAWIGHQALSKPAVKAAPTPAPLKVVQAKASTPSAKSLSEMSMEEYAAARAAGRGG